MKNKDAALLLLRIGVGLIFIIAGWGKLTGIEGFRDFWKCRYPNGFSYGVGGSPCRILRGILILIGYKVQIPGYLLAIVMLVAMFVILGREDSGFGSIRLELMLLLTSLALTMTGPGSYSLDASLNKPSD